MIRIAGPSFDDLDPQIEEMDRLVQRIAARIFNQVADDLGNVRVAAAPPPPEEIEEPGEPAVSLDTLAVIVTLWAAAVTAEILPAISDIFYASLEKTREALFSALSPERGANLPEADSDLVRTLAEEYLAGAPNRMSGFGDEMWNVARAQLLEGFMKGESIWKLRDRLRASVGLTTGRASLVARTEVISASNAGSLSMIEVAGFTGTKTWLATEDARTRPTHVLADGDTVAIPEAFVVGGFPLFFPGDPAGPPEEICNCRCTLTYNLDDEPLAATGVDMEDDALTSAAVKPHDTSTSDGTWDKDSEIKKLPSPMSVATARAVYAWIDDSAIDDGKLPKDACKFPHHEIGADGKPGAANLAACSAGIAALHGARGGTSIPESDRRGVYNHLATHLKDAGRTPPDFIAASALTAGAYVLTIPDAPPAEWFDEPVDVDIKGAITVTDEGRVYGFIGPDQTPHRGYRDRDIFIPMGNVDYSRFLKGEMIVEGGGRVVAGVITADCGHSRTADQMDHYDNTCSMVAAVNVGEWPGRGVWMAGALLPGVKPDQVTKMMQGAISGEWRPVKGAPGRYEFMKALVVPVPGFAMGRTQPSVMASATEDDAVACTVPVVFASSNDECGCSKPVNMAQELETLAASVGLDLSSRMNALHESVMKG